MFSSFDVCLLPTEFSEKKRRPIFPNEETVRGAFADGTPKEKVQVFYWQFQLILRQYYFSLAIITVVMLNTDYGNLDDGKS